MVTRATRAHVQLFVREGALPQFANAEVYGGLALFRISHGWNITHVNSGIRLFEVYEPKAKALEVVGILSGFDWASIGAWGYIQMTPEAEQARRRAAECLYPKPIPKQD